MMSQENVERLNYLKRELEVWEARRRRALAPGAPKGLQALYLAPELDEALGEMVREKRELEEMLGREGRRKSRRRKRTDLVRMDRVVEEAPEREGSG